MSFHRLCEVTTAIFALLCAGLLIAPDAFATVFGFAPSIGAEVMARRAGVLFAPLALILWTVRNLTDEPLRREFARAALVMMSGLVLLGLLEWFAGRVGAGITIPLAIETTLGALFFRFAFPRS